MELFLEDAVAAGPTDGLDEAGFETLDGDGAVPMERETLVGVIFVDELDCSDTFALRLFKSLRGEVTVSKNGGLVAVVYIRACFQFQRQRGLGRYSLLHLSKCFASDAFFTLPVRLGTGKMKSTTREGSLLQDPAPAVQIAGFDVFSKVVDGFANVERNSTPEAPHQNSLSFRSGLDEAIIGSGSARRSENAVRRAEDQFHTLRLKTPVLLAVLDDAKRVNPEEAVTEAASSFHGV